MNKPLLSPEALATSTALGRADVERWPVTDRASWLARRQQDVTASAIGALLGVHDYQTALGLYLLKSGQIEEDADETPAMRRGRLLEPVAIQLLREQHPTWTITPGTHYFRDPAKRIGATPDAVAIDPERPGFGIVQIKCVEPSVFAKKWRQDGTIEPPLWIACQAVVEANLTGASWAAVAPMRVSFGIDIEAIDIPLHAALMARLEAEVATFWQRIADKNPPPADYGRDGSILAKLYDADDGTVIDLTGDNRLPEMIEEDARLADEIKERKALRDAIKAEVLEKMGCASVALVNGRTAVTAKTVHRKSYTVAASSYRDVRLKRSA